MFAFKEKPYSILILSEVMSSSDAFNQPFLPPPGGLVPNYTKPHSTGRSLTITCSIFLGIMIVFVMVRLYTKLKIIKKATWDDCISPPACNSSRSRTHYNDRSGLYSWICMNSADRGTNTPAKRRPSKALNRYILCPLRER